MCPPEHNLLLHTEQNQHKLKQSLLLPQFYTQQNCYLYDTEGVMPQNKTSA